MAFVLSRTNKPGYVAKSGHSGSYTTDLRYARKYLTKDAAVADSCVENEVPVYLEHLLQQYRG